MIADKAGDRAYIICRQAEQFLERAGVLSVMQSPGTDLADLVLKEQRPARMAHG